MACACVGFSARTTDLADCVTRITAEAVITLIAAEKRIVYHPSVSVTSLRFGELPRNEFRVNSVLLF